MKNISKNTIIIILLGFLWFISILSIQLYNIPEFEKITGQKLLDFGGFDEYSINNILSSYGDEGINFYNQIQIVDFFAPVFFGLLLSLISFRLLYLIKGKYYFIGYFPLLLTVFDLVENGIIYSILKTYPEKINPNIANTLLTISEVKFLFYGLSVLLTIGLTIFWIIGKIRER